MDPIFVFHESLWRKGHLRLLRHDLHQTSRKLTAKHEQSLLPSSSDEEIDFGQTSKPKTQPKVEQKATSVEQEVEVVDDATESDSDRPQHKKKTSWFPTQQQKGKKIFQMNSNHLTLIRTVLRMLQPRKRGKQTNHLSRKPLPMHQPWKRRETVTYELSLIPQPLNWTVPRVKNHQANKIQEKNQLLVHLLLFPPLLMLLCLVMLSWKKQRKLCINASISIL
jgi:ABC-type uncharacterized transport system involved in gliding motility auxiliary subunit